MLTGANPSLVMLTGAIYGGVKVCELGGAVAAQHDENKCIISKPFDLWYVLVSSKPGTI